MMAADATNRKPLAMTGQCWFGTWLETGFEAAMPMSYLLEKASMLRLVGDVSVKSGRDEHCHMESSKTPY